MSAPVGTTVRRADADKIGRARTNKTEMRLRDVPRSAGRTALRPIEMPLPYRAGASLLPAETNMRTGVAGAVAGPHGSPASSVAFGKKRKSAPGYRLSNAIRYRGFSRRFGDTKRCSSGDVFRVSCRDVRLPFGARGRPAPLAAPDPNSAVNLRHYVSRKYMKKMNKNALLRYIYALAGAGINRYKSHGRIRADFMGRETSGTTQGFPHR